jgi:hypothetical protein
VIDLGEVGGQHRLDVALDLELVDHLDGFLVDQLLDDTTRELGKLRALQTHGVPLAGFAPRGEQGLVEKARAAPTASPGGGHDG